MGNARLGLKDDNGLVVLVGPRGPARLTRSRAPGRPRSPGKHSRALRGLAVFWGAVVLGAALGAAALQALGPPGDAVPPAGSSVAGQDAAGAAPVLPPAPNLSAQAPSLPVAGGPPAALPAPETLPVPPRPMTPPPRVPPAAAVQADPAASTARPGQPNAPVRRAVIHYRAGSAMDDAERLAGRARALAGRVELRAVPATPSRPGIRYFFTEDASAAEALAAALASAGAGAFQVRGFPDYRPSPQPGTIEVWLP